MSKGTYKEPVYKSSLDDEGYSKNARRSLRAADGGSYLN